MQGEPVSGANPALAVWPVESFIFCLRVGFSIFRIKKSKCWSDMPTVILNEREFFDIILKTRMAC